MKEKLITIIFICVILISALGIIIFNKSYNSTEVDAKFIGDNSILYVQSGCSHCLDQEKIFGDNLKYLNMVDCFKELDKCKNITATPTWLIKGKYYIGVKSIDELKSIINEK